MDTSTDTEHRSAVCTDGELHEGNKIDQAIALLDVKDDVIKAMTDHLNDVTRTISGYAGMLERHLSIQDDTIGSEYAVGIRSGLEQLHTLLHHLRPIARQRSVDLRESQQALTQLGQAISEEK